MDGSLTEPICRHEFEAQKLVTDFPPRITDPNKKMVYDIACPPGCGHRGRLVFSRWRSMELPETIPLIDLTIDFEARENVFGYEPPKDDTSVEWYLNFANYDLFSAYGGPLFAQDEMQVAEHPALGSLREALLGMDTGTLTVEENMPTPILVRGVERRCRIATEPNPQQMRPSGLYGNNFATAAAEAIELATTPITPPTTTNLIAIEAPAYGRGVYSLEEIRFITTTAYTGFAAATIESRLGGNRARTVVHTGFWGCGAYGGNRVLMALLQFVAAMGAGFERLVFHTFDSSGTESHQVAQGIFRDVLSSSAGELKVQSVLKAIHDMGFEWGVGSGT